MAGFFILCRCSDLVTLHRAFIQTIAKQAAADRFATAPLSVVASVVQPARHNSKCQKQVKEADGNGPRMITALRRGTTIHLKENLFSKW
jgi:hypothetical protein